MLIVLYNAIYDSFKPKIPSSLLHNRNKASQ
jgi:hypothetical protein